MFAIIPGEKWKKLMMEKVLWLCVALAPLFGIVKQTFHQVTGWITRELFIQLFIKNSHCHFFIYSYHHLHIHKQLFIIKDYTIIGDKKRSHLPYLKILYTHSLLVMQSFQVCWPCKNVECYSQPRNIQTGIFNLKKVVSF